GPCGRPSRTVGSSLRAPWRRAAARGRGRKGKAERKTASSGVGRRDAVVGDRAAVVGGRSNGGRARLCARRLLHRNMHASRSKTCGGGGKRPQDQRVGRTGGTAGRSGGGGEAVADG